MFLVVLPWRYIVVTLFIRHFARCIRNPPPSRVLSCQNVLCDFFHRMFSEYVTVRIPLENPMKIPLVFSNLHLLWTFQSQLSVDPPNRPDETRTSVTNETPSGLTHLHRQIVASEIIPELIILPNERKAVSQCSQGCVCYVLQMRFIYFNKLLFVLLLILVYFEVLFSGFQHHENRGFLFYISLIFHH